MLVDHLYSNTFKNEQSFKSSKSNAGLIVCWSRGCWSRGVVLSLGVRGSGFNSQMSPASDRILFSHFSLYLEKKMTIFVFVSTKDRPVDDVSTVYYAVL